SSSVTRTVVVRDTIAPVITIAGANPMTNECYVAFTDPGASANDDCEGSVSVSTTGSVNANAPGTYTLTYTSTDVSGNSSSVTRTVVVRDTIAPVITIAGANPMTNECHVAFTDPGASANDACEGSVSVSTTGSVDANTPGTYSLHDALPILSGNSSSVTRTVVVRDTIAPVITIAGANPMTNECHVAFTDPGASANDACEGSLSVSTTGSVNANTPGTYTLTYTSTDASGNSSS